MQKKCQFKNGYTFNRVINGCWQLSAEHCLQGHLDYDDAIRAFHELVEQGFTTFDCADIYTGAEEVLGRFVMELKESGHYQEEDIQIHTKFVPDKDVLPVINMKYTEGIVDRSLKRMHRETLDLVQFHWWDFDVPGMMETAFDLVRLQEKGKIRNIGMCNMDTNALKQMVDAGIPVVSNQAQYSVFDRRPERTLLDYSAEHGIYTFAYGTLAGGFLAERYMGKAYEAPETRSQVKYADHRGLVRLGWHAETASGTEDHCRSPRSVDCQRGNPVYLKSEECGRSYGWNQKFQTCSVQSSDPGI